MRGWLVAVALLAGCKSKQDAARPVEPLLTNTAKPDPVRILAVPSVASATVLAKVGKRPPLLVLVESAAMARPAAAATWEDLDAGILSVAKQAAPPLQVIRFQRAGQEMGRDPMDAITRENEPSDIDLSTLEDSMPRSSQAPAPPRDDEYEEESGGSGEAMALDEGKMGPSDSTRAEGQYKMQKPPSSPSNEATGWKVPYAPHRPPNEDGSPSRVVSGSGTIVENGVLDPLYTMVVVPPLLPASMLVDLVTDSPSAIAVIHDGHIRPLRVQFDLGQREGVAPSGWVEVRVSTAGVTIEAVPDAVTMVTTLEPAPLAAAIATARIGHGFKAEAAADVIVDVLVEPDVTSQRFIDVLAALDAAGVRQLGVGNVPPTAELARRGHRIPKLQYGAPTMQGDLARKVLTAAVKARRPAFAACYTKALAANPALAGTVTVQFFITPNGTVASSSGSGVDADLSSCFALTVKAIEFPKPKGGGGVQVNYPFTMRP